MPLQAGSVARLMSDPGGRVSGCAALEELEEKHAMVASYHDVSKMLTKIGPRLKLVEIAAFEDQHSWAIAVDDQGETVVLDYDAPTGKLYMTTELAPPPPDRLLATYEFLLQYNLFWSDTDGVRMALDAPGGTVMQIHDIVLHGLDAHRLEIVLENFIILSRTMRAMLHEGIGEDEASDADHAELITTGSIRA